MFRLSQRVFTLSIFAAMVMFAGAAVGQSHVHLIDQTPCLLEYRVWYLKFLSPQPFPVPRDFTTEQCAQAVKVHERIQQERNEASNVSDPNPGPKDADERAIDCLHEYRLWKSIDKGQTNFEDALQSFAPFKVQGTKECKEAKSAEALISAAAEVKRVNEQAQAERERKAELRAQAAQSRREAAVRSARDAQLKKPGVRIGMTPEDVIERSNWGSPQSKRRTTTATGVREQWIYEGQNYLYFENGKLTAIQN